jgi:hypothetical protein
MSDHPRPLDDATHAALRLLLRYAIVMAFVALLAGLAFQESSRKLDFAKAPPGRHIESVLHLALVHGHAFTLGVLMPLAMAGALLIARRVGAAPLSPRALAWLTRGYLPFAAVAVALMLYKGYHVLLSVRMGETDFVIIDAALFGGVKLLRHGIYGIAHTGMGVALGVFLVALWRSLPRGRAR